MRLLAMLGLLAMPTFAQGIPGEMYSGAEVVRPPAITPAIGQTVTATAGSPIYDFQNRAYFRAVKLIELAQWGHFGTYVFVSADRLLFVVPDQPVFTGCRYDKLEPSRKICLYDVDGDGRFDEGELSVGGQLKEHKTLNAKALYSQPYEEPIALASGAFHSQLIYLGMSGSTLRLSYREFVNDMARPAFAEEVTFNMTGKYPETVAYKDLVIDIIGVGNAGLRYVITKANSGASAPTPH